MAPLKFEEHIKEELDKREIAPSDRAWDQLSSQLSSKGRDNVKTKFFRLGIAAAIIGLLIVSMVYINRNRVMKKEDIKTVSAPAPVVKGAPATLPNNIGVEGNREVATTKKPSDVLVEKTNKTANKIVPSIAHTPITAQEKNEKLVRGVEHRETKLVEKEWNGQDSLINAKIIEVVEQVDLMERTDISLTDAEVDSLLKQAQKELFAESKYLEGHSVDAMALLADVEGELDQNSREQLFEILKAGYIKVRTAVATRNK
ncbi:hypothetical protein QSE00_15120 [Arenibacter sp. M-2]|uniref:hypothetical protein n=1 Tax=Arenibacter sp. M-2 TaxID=3053612 RepID=UPI0025706425|nr:hypothetical protein [Arenibacter sp. M-2]MDL5513156.1 hypothetical protein [Arenibacter sp. M-2]|tara:strand:- start:13602 stop:14375 length:774 start_codon:yes stop_codon:yes gene_type:complete